MPDIEKSIPNDNSTDENPVLRLSAQIFGGNPYRDFAPTLGEPDLQGWNGLHRELIRAVQVNKPRIILDVGVWKGQSTVTLAKTQRDVRDDGFVIAIDSFLGSPEHWTPERADVHKSLAFRNGRPSFYETFLSNIVLSGLQDRVLPIAQTSENAAVILKRLGVAPDLIHIDAAHEYGPVMRDMELYWELLAPGGLLMGDDFPWPGVCRAVVHFSDRLGVPFEVNNPKWWMRKPA